MASRGAETTFAAAEDFFACAAGGGRRWLALPFLASFSGYGLPSLRNDVSAGLAVAAVGLPSAIAYPAIAGLPPETGIYASIAPLIAYALFGPSRKLIVGPDAATMTVLAAVLTAVLASAEDSILSKLEWSRKSGESQQQLADAAGVVRMAGGDLDVAYIERWAAELGVLDLWRRVALSPA